MIMVGSGSGLWCLAVLQQAAVLPIVIFYAAAVSACEKGQHWQQALGLLAVLQQLLFCKRIA